MVYAGWSKKGKSFTKKEFSKTSLKKSGMTFKNYKKSLKNQSKDKRLKKALFNRF